MTINKSLILFLSNFRFKPNMNYAEQESQEKVYPQEKVSPQEETIKTQQVVIHPQQNVEAGDQQKEETPLVVQNQEEATKLDECKLVEVVVAVTPDEVEVPNPITNNGIYCCCLPGDYDQLSQDSALTEVSDCGSNDSGYDSSDFDFDSQDSWF